MEIESKRQFVFVIVVGLGRQMKKYVKKYQKHLDGIEGRVIKMYRVYHLTNEEKDKIVRCRWDGDTHYYDVFESQEECDEEQKRLDKIEAEYRKKKADYLKNCKGE